MSKVATENKKEVTAKVVVGDDERIIIPRSMTKLEASIQLKKQHEEEETLIDLIHEFNTWNYKDSLVALMKTMKDVFGWVPGVPTYSFFGVSNPKEINVEVGFDSKGRSIYEPCFLGEFRISQWENAKGTAYINNSGDTAIVVTAKKKYAERVRKFFTSIQTTLTKDSIYKGKSIMVNTGINPHTGSSILDFNFIQNKVSDKIVLNVDEERVVKNLVIAPLGKEGKRCILLTGDYGTGKTETAMRIGKEGTDKGMTFFYCKESTLFPQLLNKAKLYTPTIIFLEDIDEIGSGEERTARMNNILNTLDGIQSKGSNLTVIFTTNHVNRINKALRRPGRIDQIIEFKPCLLDTRAEIYRRLFRDVSGNETIDYQAIAEKSPEVQGAIIAEIGKRAIDISELSMDGRISDEAVYTAITSMADHIKFMEEDPEEFRDKRKGIVDDLVSELTDSIIEII